MSFTLTDRRRLCLSSRSDWSVDSMSVLQWNSWGLMMASISESHLGNFPILKICLCMFVWSEPSLHTFYATFMIVFCMLVFGDCCGTIITIITVRFINRTYIEH